jgi:hypothetical protein
MLRRILQLRIKAPKRTAMPQPHNPAEKVDEAQDKAAARAKDNKDKAEKKHEGAVRLRERARSNRRIVL